MSHEQLFQLRFRVSPYRWRDRVTINVRNMGCDYRGAVKYDAEVKVNGKVLFPYGTLWGTFSPLDACDGPNAKANVILHLAMSPGDTDDDFFEDYTVEQLAFVIDNSDEIYMESLDRYGEL